MLQQTLEKIVYGIIAVAVIVALVGIGIKINKVEKSSDSPKLLESESTVLIEEK